MMKYKLTTKMVKRKKDEPTDGSDDDDKNEKNKKKKRKYDGHTDESDDDKNNKKKKGKKADELSVTDGSDDEKNNKKKKMKKADELAVNSKKQIKNHSISESDISDDDLDNDENELAIQSVHIGGPENGYISKPHIEFSLPIPNTPLFCGCGRRPDTKPKKEFLKLSNTAKESYKEKLKHRGYEFYLINFLNNLLIG